MRVTSDGLWHDTNCTVRAYLREKMNLLDLAVLLFGTTELICYLTDVKLGVGLTALRALRTLRILKLIKSLPNLRLIIDVIVGAMPSILELVFFGWMVILFFMVLGVHLYKGLLSRACYWTDETHPEFGTQVAVRPCAFTYASGAHLCSSNQTCFDDQSLPDEFPPMEKLFNGTVSFDHAGLAYYAVFVAGTMEGWHQIMEGLDDAIGNSGNWLFFVVLVIFGGYILMSMLVGALAGWYIKLTTFAKNEKAREERRSMRTRAMSKIGRMGGFGTMKLRKQAGQEITTAAPEGFMAYDDETANDAASAGGTTSSFFDDNILEISVGRGGGPQTLDQLNSRYPKIMALVKNTWFQRFILFIITTNAVFLSLDHYPQTDTWLTMLTIGNYFFVGVFVVEMILKMVAYGVKGYYKRPSNRFDAVVTIASVIELLVLEIGGIDNELSLGAFRSLRLLRVLRLSSDWNQLRSYARGSFSALQALGSLLLLIVLFLVIVSLIGMQIFGGKFWSRTNYNRFDEAMLTSFQLQTCTSWNEIMYEGIQVLGGPKGVSALPGVFFIAIVVVGHYILFSVLLAIAYKNLNDQMPNPKTEQLSKDQIIQMHYKRNIKDRTIMVPHSSLFIFSVESWLRGKCHALTCHRYFEPIILGCIIVGSILLGAEDYNNPANPRNDVLYYFEIFFAAIFAVEMVVKIVAKGFVVHKGAYLRSGWNVLDFIIVVSSLISLPLKDQNVGVVRVIRTFRVMRPLRAVSRAPGLKRVVESMVQSVKRIWGILCVALVFLFCFSILGVSLFKGRFQYCNDNNMLIESNCTGNYTMELPLNKTRVVNRAWKTHYTNFDTALSAAGALVSITGFEGWPDLYRLSADTSAEFAIGPVLNNRSGGSFVFYVVFLLVVALFFVNIVMAFVVLTYQKQADSKFAVTGLTSYTAKCLRYALSIPIPRDYHFERRGTAAMTVVESDRFSDVALIIVLLNIGQLCMPFYTASQGYVKGIDITNYVFTACFAIEMIIKMIGYGFKGYWVDRWHWFDAFIVAGSLSDCIAGDTVAVLGVFRALRVFKVFNHRKFNHIFHAVLQSLSSVLWVTVLAGLLFYIYAIIGMVLFARIPVVDGDAEDAYAKGINFRWNFSSLPRALFLLFRAMTGEKWQSLMEDTYIEDHEFCDPDDPLGTTCGSRFNAFYFISFTLISTLLVLNVVVAVIMDNFETVNMEPSDLQVGHIKLFVERWKEKDPRATGKLHHSELIPLLKQVEPPFGLGKMCPRQASLDFVGKLPVPLDDEGFIKFRPTLVAIIRARLNLWMYDFPSQDTLYQIMHHVAPYATIEHIYDAVPKDSTRISGRVMSLRVFYLVVRLQNIFRQGLHQKVKKSGVSKAEFLRKSSVKARLSGKSIKKKKSATPGTPAQTRGQSSMLSLVVESSPEGLYDDTELDLSQWSGNATVNKKAMHRAANKSIKRQISIEASLSFSPQMAALSDAEEREEESVSANHLELHKQAAKDGYDAVLAEFGADDDASWPPNLSAVHRASPTLNSFFNASPFPQPLDKPGGANAGSSVAMAAVLAEFGGDDEEGDDRIVTAVSGRPGSAPPADDTLEHNAALAAVLSEFGYADARRSASVPPAATNTPPATSAAAAAALDAVLAEFGGDHAALQTTRVDVGNYVAEHMDVVLSEWNSPVKVSADVSGSASSFVPTSLPTTAVGSRTVTIVKVDGLKLGIGLAPGVAGSGPVVKMVVPGTLADGKIEVNSTIVSINSTSVVGAGMSTVARLIKTNKVLTFSVVPAGGASSRSSTDEPSEWEKLVASTDNGVTL